MFEAMYVLKFGGAPLRSADGFRHMVNLLKTADRSVVVISAIGSTTRDLRFCCDLAVHGSVTEAASALQQIIARHNKLAREVLEGAPSSGYVDKLHTAERELQRLLTSISITRQCTPRTLDRVLAYGEHLSLMLTMEVLAGANIDAASISAQSWLVTTGDHGNARPIEVKTRVHVERDLAPLLDDHAFVITEGFVGSTELGAPTTMGNESSNLTATLLASMLEATQVIIYTDVPGIRSADPKVCGETMLRGGFTFEQAKHASKHGLKLLYPTMIEPAARAGIPICITSVEPLQSENTVIASTAPPSDPIVTIHEGDSAETKRVSVVFSSVQRWTSAIAEAAKNINDFEECYVSSDPADQSLTILCRAENAATIAGFLHDYLIMNPKNAS